MSSIFYAPPYAVSISIISPLELKEATTTKFQSSTSRTALVDSWFTNWQSDKKRNL